MKISFAEREKYIMQTYYQYQDEINVLFHKQNWQYWSSLSIIGRLLEEQGELAREINHLYGDKKKRMDESKNDIEEEIGDMIYTIICFANKDKYDLDRAVRKAPQENGEYKDRHPLSIIAELASRVGVFADEINLQNIDPNVDISKSVDEMRLGNILRILEHLADRLEYTLDSAIRKSIDKVISRDKNRFS